MPNSKLNRFENWQNWGDDTLDDHLRTLMASIFSLAEASSVSEFEKDDLILDVFMVDLRRGDFGLLRADGGLYPMGYRPKIQLISRIHHARTGSTRNTFRVSQSVRWSEFVRKSISFKGLLGIGTLYGQEEMEKLLMQACLQLLDQMRKTV
ncbi:hypothetical protein [Photobacterium sp. 1_MG-2023]|uniref:hypothetical protein n=1 Tax=Photobacterium sp. 1_MG-2023 TaxID=3062646 RepID=UPI0026E1437B|nr:hypothetical protein [Photobacterium sp. 1_MG-2023]MDO6705512.1 hypothetical protein [Photobacterium sp. 1_MG-2023]